MKTVSRHRFQSIASLGLTLAVLGVGCGADDRAATADRAYVDDQLQTRFDGFSRAEFYERIEQILPNRQYKEPGQPPRQFSDRVVIGEFVDAQPGRARGPEGERVDFDSRDASTRTVHFEFRVDESFGADGPNPAKIGIAFDSKTDFARVRRGFTERGKTVVFLTTSPVFAYDENLAAVVEDGAIIADVDSEGRLSLPFIAGGRAASMLERVDTLEELRHEAQKPTRTIPIRREGGVVQPPED